MKLNLNAVKYCRLSDLKKINDKCKQIRKLSSVVPKERYRWLFE